MPRFPRTEPEVATAGSEPSNSRVIAVRGAPLSTDKSLN
jgi:hypothetical protein